jgi:hypothetical protein
MKVYFIYPYQSINDIKTQLCQLSYLKQCQLQKKKLFTNVNVVILTLAVIAVVRKLHNFMNLLLLLLFSS